MPMFLDEEMDRLGDPRRRGSMSDDDLDAVAEGLVREANRLDRIDAPQTDRWRSMRARLQIAQERRARQGPRESSRDDPVGWAETVRNRASHGRALTGLGSTIGSLDRRIDVEEGFPRQRAAAQSLLSRYGLGDVSQVSPQFLRQYAQLYNTYGPGERPSWMTVSPQELDRFRAEGQLASPATHSEGQMSGYLRDLRGHFGVDGYSDEFLMSYRQMRDAWLNNVGGDQTRLPNYLRLDPGMLPGMMRAYADRSSEADDRSVPGGGQARARVPYGGGGGTGGGYGRGWSGGPGIRPWPGENNAPPTGGGRDFQPTPSDRDWVVPGRPWQWNNRSGRWEGDPNQEAPGDAQLMGGGGQGGGPPSANPRRRVPQIRPWPGRGGV